ncbi:acyltransferase [Bifidobacterium lemurum]|uniref:Acyltransferase n=1 Tax=Bifidobacterium lemurum TaxID=1603886 RepID=A0A261FTL7_9BIFI|nr:acyltransferase [Bifidobacterium lemurum]
MSSQRFVGLDGIKGFALIAIVLYHCKQSVLPGGFYGVDVFFTVSGFLTALGLVRALNRGRGLDLARYLPRRATRIYPALLFMLPAVVTLAWLVDRDLLVGIRDQIITAALGCYNWYAIANGQSYFEQMSPQIMRHLWYVGVLMQFMLVLPLIVGVMWKIRRTRLSLLIPLGLAAASATAMWLLYTPGGDPTRVYFGTDTHACGLMLGVALAWIIAYDGEPSATDGEPSETDGEPRPGLGARIWRALAPMLAFLSLIALIALAVTGDQNEFAFRGGIIIASLLAVLLIAGTISTDSWMQDLMVFKPLAACGRYSYGIYLWHWPMWLLSLAVVPRLIPTPGPWVWAVAAILTAVAVAASWKLIEQPAGAYGAAFVLWPGKRFTNRQIARAVIVALLMAGSIAGCVQGVKDAPAKTSIEIQLEQQAAELERMRELNGTMTKTAVPQPRKPKHTMPSGGEITAIGDSVMLASSNGLNAAFPGIQVDAEVSRNMGNGLELVRERLGEGMLRQWVVLGIGTNGPADVGQLDQISAALGSDRVMVLVNAHGDRSWIPPNNQLFSDYAAAHSDSVVLVDWNAAAEGHRDDLASDGIHPGMTNDYYAQAVRQAIEQWIAAGH